MKSFRFATLLWILSIVIILPAQPLVAQESTPTKSNRIMLYGGTALPVGNFAAAPVVLNQSNISAGSFGASSNLVSTNLTYGNAQPGFTVGVGDLYALTDNISLCTTLDVNVNAYNNAETNRILSSAWQSLGAASGSTVNTSVNIRQFINTTLLVGGRYDIPLSSLLNLFATVQVGALYGILPQQDGSVRLDALNSTTALGIAISSMYSSSSSLAFASAFGVGALVSNHINIWARYIVAAPNYSGSGTSTFAITAPANSPLSALGSLGSQTVPTTYSINFPTGFIQISVGYIF